MSHKGNGYDNAVIENFFGILKSEFLYSQEFENTEQFKGRTGEIHQLLQSQTDKGKTKRHEPNNIPGSCHRGCHAITSSSLQTSSSLSALYSPVF